MPTVGCVIELSVSSIRSIMKLIGASHASADTEETAR